MLNWKSYTNYLVETIKLKTTISTLSITHFYKTRTVRMHGCFVHRLYKQCFVINFESKWAPQLTLFIVNITYSWFCLCKTLSVKYEITRNLIFAAMLQTEGACADNNLFPIAIHLYIWMSFKLMSEGLVLVGIIYDVMMIMTSMLLQMLRVPSSMTWIQ